MTESAAPARRLIVQKYGGSSVGTAEKIAAVARKVVATRRQGHDVVVVVSAMGHSTDELLALARQVADDPHRRELDLLLATGEQVSTALLAMAIRHLGEAAVGLSGGQAGIVTNDVHSNARILRIHTDRLREELARGAVVVVTGFQGVSPAGEVTTLGRGGSDTSATALAAALGADACQIFTDVDGVYSADPRKVPGAQRLDELGSDEMQELAWHGAQVMKAEAVEFAKSNGVSFELASTFGDRPGSRIHAAPTTPEEAARVFSPHRPAVAGVAGREDLVRLVCTDAAEDAGRLDSFFAAIAGYDLVFGRHDAMAGTIDLLLSTQEIPNPDQLARDLAERHGGAVTMTADLGAVSLVGFGLGSRPAALYAALAALRQAGIAVHGCFTGRESLSFVVAAAAVREGTAVLHRAFIETGLDPKLNPAEGSGPAPALAG